MDIEHYRTLLQNEERRLLGVIRRTKENVRSIGGDSVPDAGDASYDDGVREEQAREAENASDTLLQRARGRSRHRPRPAPRHAVTRRRADRRRGPRPYQR